MVEAFTLFDWFVIVVITLSGVFGLLRGFCSEATSTFGWILALWLMLKHSDKIEGLLIQTIPEPNIRMIVATFLLFLGVLIIAKMTGLVLKTFVSMIGLGPFDRLLGLFFGFARGFLIVGLIILFLQFFNLDTGILTHSKFAHHFKTVNHAIVALSKPMIKDKIPSSINLPALPTVDTQFLKNFVNQ